MSARSLRKIPATYQYRLNTLRTRIHQKSLGGYLVNNPIDQFYLTGFDGEDGAALVTPQQVFLVTDGRFKDEVKVAAPWATAVVRTGSLSEAIQRVTRKLRIKRLGFQPEALTVHYHRLLQRAVRPARLIPVPQVMHDLRIIKDAGEIGAIEKAGEVAEAAFKAVTRRIRLGMTERELAAELQHELLRRGASSPSFPIIVAEGLNSAFPHAKPGNRKIQAGSAVLIDWGATVDHYRSDLTRMIFIRKIPPRFRRMYEPVLAAQLAGISAIRPDVRMCDVDAKARNLLKRAGMARQFSHSLGHGLGLDIHEAPRLAKRITDPLKVGMVVTVEPGVYFPGVGGVRIEDDVVVTADGCRLLTSLPKDLESAIV